MTLDRPRRIALAILRKNAPTLIILGLFPFGVGLRGRNGTLVPYTNWPFVIGSAILLPGAYFLLLFIVTVAQDVADARREEAGSITFSGAIGWRLLLAGLVVLAVGLDMGIYRQEGRLTTSEVAFGVGFCLLAFYCWPRTIEFSNGALVQGRMLGGMKSILYSDVTAAKFDVRQQCIVITGRNGVRIVHSMFHAGRKQFARQFELLTGRHILGLTT
jgi:hypothetical protein